MQPTGAPPQPPPAPKPFATSGPWSFTGIANVDLIANVAGGIKSAAKGLSKFALAAAYDGSEDDHDGLTGLVSAQFVHGGRISANAVGDIQSLDNIEAGNALRLYEAWIAHDYDNRVGWKLGLIDLNVDFDTQETGSLFLNSSDGIGPDLGRSGLNGPSIYPTTALGLTGYLRQGAGLTIRAGLFDGTAGSPLHPDDFAAIHLSARNGVLGIAQAEQRFDSGLRLEAGAWGYSAAFDAIYRTNTDGSPRRYARTHGVYALVEGPLIKSASGDERGLSGWVRVGVDDCLVEQVCGYLGGGLVYTGPIARRAGDQIGIAINHAIVDAPGDAVTLSSRKSAETAFELTYRYNATDLAGGPAGHSADRQPRRRPADRLGRRRSAERDAEPHARR